MPKIDWFNNLTSLPLQVFMTSTLELPQLIIAADDEIQLKQTENWNKQVLDYFFLIIEIL